MVQLIDQLEEERAKLLGLQQAALWAALFPHAQAGAESPNGLIARGLAEPITATLGLTPPPQLQAAAVLELLRRDADAIRTPTAAQRAQIEGRNPDKRAAGAVWND